MSKFLLYQQDGPVVTLTMNQPDIRNVLTGNTAVPEFVEACARITSDRTVKVLIITGAGSAFSAGGNVKDMRRFFEDDIAPAAIREEYRQGIQRIHQRLAELELLQPKDVVSIAEKYLKHPQVFLFNSQK